MIFSRMYSSSFKLALGKTFLFFYTYYIPQDDK